MRTATTLAVIMITMMAFPTGAKAEGLDTWTALKNAVEAGGTVTMTHDITRDVYESIRVTGTVSVTLDLHGHKINGSGDTYPYSNIFDVDNSGNLTITDLSEAKDGEIYGARNDIITITNSGVVTLAAGTLGKSSCGVSVASSSNCSFTMTGGAINTVGGTGVFLSGGSFTMSGGTITGNQYGVTTYSVPCTITVSGNVTFSGNTTADVFMNSIVRPIVIGGDLSPDTRIGVSTEVRTDDANGKPFTSGLGTHGSASNFFVSGRSDLGIVAEGSELYFGQLMATNDAGGTLGKWCSYYNFGPRHMRACSGVTAYKAKVNAAKTGVELTELFTDGGVINNGQGVLLKSDGDIVLMTTSADPDGDYEGNELTGANSDTDQGSNAGKCYVLSKKDGKFGFFLLETGVQTKAHKAYLIVEPSSAGSRGFLSIGDDGATAINNSPLDPWSLATEGTQEFTTDNSAGAWYSMDGRRLTGKPARKGIYVRDGKKFVIK